MPQTILKRLFGKLDRKRIIVAAIVAGVGIAGWRLMREPRDVEETEWDSIVFPEMAGSSAHDIAPPPAPARTEAPRTLTPQDQPDSRGMQIEVAANAALRLDDEWRPEPRPIPRHPGVSLVREPTRLEGGIEPIDAPTE